MPFVEAPSGAATGDKLVKNALELNPKIHEIPKIRLNILRTSPQSPRDESLTPLTALEPNPEYPMPPKASLFG